MKPTKDCKSYDEKYCKRKSCRRCEFLADRPSSAQFPSALIFWLAGIDTEEFMDCECKHWCQVEPQPLKDPHHKKCPKYDEEIRIVKITHEGVSYYDKNIVDALAGLADGDNCKYEVELMPMLEREYVTLPEFAGFQPANENDNRRRYAGN